MLRTIALLSIAAVLTTSGAAPADAGNFVMQPISVKDELGAQALGINAANEVIGGVQLATGYKAFTFKDGKLTLFQAKPGVPSTGNAINNLGEIVGEYQPTGDTVSIFTRTANGVNTLVSVPGFKNVYPYGIGKAGEIVGMMNNPGGPLKGFLVAGGKTTTLLPPGTIEAAAYGINAKGVVVGSAKLPAAPHNQIGFTYVNGIYTTIVVPGATSTSANFISDSGVIGGNYTDSTGRSIGFIKSGTKITTIDVNGTTNVNVVGIGPKGEVVGNFVNRTDYTSYGFIKLEGSYFIVDPTNKTGSTHLTGVNFAGSIVGYYYRGSNTAANAFVLECPTGQAPCTP